MHDSDYFDGLCPCNDFPCKRSVAAQAKLEAEERVRIAVMRTYYEHHEKWPQRAFTTCAVTSGSLPPQRTPSRSQRTSRALSFEISQARSYG